MLLVLRNVLDAERVAQLRRELDAADWVDGRATAGHLSAPVKHNQQLREDHPLTRRLGSIVLDALERHPVFLSAALPAKLVPPLFNRHAGGGAYGRHVDGSIRPIAGSAMRVRTDLAATLFLSPPEDYDGGELTIDDTLGPQPIKLPAGDVVLYPASTVHQVRPVTRGVRYASFLWVESLVREAHRRQMLFRLDESIQAIAAQSPAHASLIELTALYHNLVREWASVP